MTVEADILSVPSTDSENAIVVQAPNATWGVDQPYGSGQAFMVLRETGDPSDPGPDGAIVYRVDRYGGVGTSGGVHVATGLRGAAPGADIGIWLDPSWDVVPLFINNRLPSEGPSTRDFIAVYDQRDGTFPFRVINNGSIVETKDVISREGTALRTAIGSTYGVAGVAMGQTADTVVYRKTAGQVGIGNSAFWPELAADPAAPATGMVTYCLNVNGKRQLKVRFPTGSPIVVITEP